MRQIIIIIALIFPFTIDADVKLSHEFECCIETNSKLEHQIDNQGLIIKELKSIHNDLSLKNDTLVHTLKIAIESKEQTNKETSCDFFKLLGPLLGALLSGFAAIFVFFLGKKSETKKKNKRFIDFGEQIFILIKNLIMDLEEQEKLLQKYIKSLKEKPYTHGEYGRINLNLLDRAKSFDTTLVFDSFKQLGLENTTYIKYYSELDYLHEFFNSVYEDYKTHNSQIVTPLSNNFIQLRQEILNKIALISRDFKIKEGSTSEIYKGLNNILVDYYKSPEVHKSIDIDYDMKMIIRPIKEQLIQEIFGSSEINNSVLILAKRAGDLYQTIVDQTNILESVLSSEIGSINSSIKKLNEIKTELENKYAPRTTNHQSPI